MPIFLVGSVSAEKKSAFQCLDLIGCVYIFDSMYELMTCDHSLNSSTLVSTTNRTN